MGENWASVLERNAELAESDEETSWLLPGEAELSQDADEDAVSDTAPESTVEPERTESIDVGPDRGGNHILAGWDGLYWIFGARAERFDVTPDGVYAIGVTVSAPHDLLEIAADMLEHGPKRIELLPAYFWAQGEEPEQLDDAAIIQAWCIQFFRGAGEKDSAKLPDYLKKAVAAYKKSYNVGSPRGRKRQIVKLDVESLDNISEDMLEGVDRGKLEALRRTIEAAMSRQSS